MAEKRDRSAPVDRITPAPLAPHTVERPRVLAALSEAPARRATVLTASAGFGKTTALAMWAREHSCAWYTATAADGDPVEFARGLVASLSLHVPALAGALGPAMEGPRGPDATADEVADALAAALSSQLRLRLAGDLTLLVDDLQEVADASAGMRLVAALCHMAPRRLHLILASRTDLPFAVTRLRLNGQLLGLTAEALVFDREEVARLLGSLGGAAKRVDADAVIGLTGGWPAAVRLVAERLAATPDPERLLRSLRAGGDAAELVDTLLEAEVSAAAPEVRSVVTIGAALHSFNAELLARLGVPSAATVLESMRRCGIHVAPAPRDGWVSLTPLSRVYALRRLATADELEAVRTGAVHWCLEQGDAVSALSYACRTSDTRLVAELLEQHGSRLLASGHWTVVTEALARLGSTQWSPGIDLVAGEAAQVRGDWDRAVACLSRLVPAEGAAPASAAWRLGLIHHMRGEPQLALALYRRGRDDPEGTPGDRALAAAWGAAAAWLLGNAEECRTLVADAERLAGPEDDRVHAAIHTARAMLAALDGDRGGNDRHYLRALEHAQRAGDVLQLVRIRSNRGSRLLEEGFYGEASSELDSAIELAELAGYATMHALALSNRAVANRRTGRFDEAIRDVNAALAIQQRTGSRLAGYALTVLGDTYADQGNTTMARASYEEAVGLAEPSNDLQGLVPAMAGLARVVASEEPDLAEQLVGRALAAPANLSHASSLLAAGWVALRRDDLTAVRDFATRASAFARGRRDRAAIAEALELLAASAETEQEAYAWLREAESLWQELGCPMPVARTRLAMLHRDRQRDPAAADDVAARATELEDACRALGARGLAAQAAVLRSSTRAPARAPAVAVRTLGAFGVLRYGVAVPHRAWQSRKARDLLKILIAHRGAPVARSQLCEHLWREADPDRAGNRLAVAISTVRLVLDPAHEFASDEYVATGDGAVWLRLDRVDVDVEVFLRRAEAALATGDPADLAAAEAEYGGDFCAEDRYADWAEEFREQVRSCYVALERALAQHYAAATDHEAAIRHLHRLLTSEPYDEQAHLMIVRELDSAGRHGEARRMYRSYVRRMAELDVEPAPFPDPTAHGSAPTRRAT